MTGKTRHCLPFSDAFRGISTFSFDICLPGMNAFGIHLREYRRHRWYHISANGDKTVSKMLLSIGLAGVLLLAGPALGQEEGKDNAKPEKKEKFDRKAAENRPPTREEFQSKLKEEVPSIQPKRMARKVGPVEEFPNIESPRPELYPFTIIRRTYPDSRSISVELAMKNASGQHWKNAYITLRSPAMRAGYLFEVVDWKIDEIIGVEYTFPRSEVQDRIKNLHVSGVSGNERKSALADMLSTNRKQVLDQTELIRPGRRDGDILEAPGLISYLGRFQQPFTGIKVLPIHMKAAEAEEVSVSIPENLMLPEVVDIPLRETSEERREVARLAENFHKYGYDVQKTVDEVVAGISAEDPEVMSGNSPLLARLRDQIAVFDAAGIQLAEVVQRSKDKDVRRIIEFVTDYSRRIIGQLEIVEKAMQKKSPGFRIRESA